MRTPCIQKYTAYAYISALKQLGRTITTGWSALQDGAVSEIQDLEKTINRPSRDTGIIQNTNRGARIRPSNSGTRDLPKVITIP